MAEFYGGSASIQWVYSGGTAQLSGNYRSVSYAPGVELLEITAGADAAKSYLAAQKSGQVTVSGLIDTGGTIGDRAGTVCFVEGTGGTLILGPQGTTTALPKYSIPAICMGIQHNYGYNTPSEFSITFEQNGTRTDGVF